MSLFFEEETSSVPKNPILAFIDNLKEKEAQKQRTHEQEKDHEQKLPISQSSTTSERRDNQEKQDQKPKPQVVLEPFDYNRKPMFRQERDIIFAYSINEMLALQEISIADEQNMENCRSKLPIKSFWRLKARNSNNSGNAHSNNNSHNKSNAGNYGNYAGNYGNNINGSNNKYRNSRYGAEDNNVDGKSRKQRNRRRRSQAGGANSGSYENRQDDHLENDIELLKVEQGMESTGNAMQDFENWKSKMKEIERKKKGLPPMEAESDVSFNHQPREQQKPDIMADFFNLNSSDTQLSDALEPSSTDNSKKGSSRFSSFFKEPSGSPLASTASLEKLRGDSELQQQSQQLQQQQKTQQPQNSKMLSFFNNQTPEQAQRPMSPQVNLHTVQPTNQHHQPINFPPGIPMPEGQVPVGQGNFFFEKLLTKNKMELQTPVPTGSPSQSSNGSIHIASPMQNLPVNGHPQHQHQPQHAQGSHAHMPQGGFMPPYFQMPPQQQIPNQFHQTQGGPNPKKGASNQHLQFQQSHPMGANDRQNPNMHPMMYGMPPPPFMQNGMPPQGFPRQGFPPQGFPPNGANVQKAPNGMSQGMPPMYQNQMMHPNFQNKESR